MSRRTNRSRCYVCKEVPKHVHCRFVQFSYQAGWHTVVPLCLPCAKAIMELVAQMAQEYR